MDAIELALRKCLHVLVSSNTITERKVEEFLRKKIYSSFSNLQRNVETFVELLKDNRIHDLLDSQTLDENTTKRSISWNEMFTVRISSSLQYFIHNL
jgi:citrate lyase alpha subunit